MPKITHHIPTEQFGFTEVEVAEADHMTYEEAKSLYGVNLSQPEGFGLDLKTFNDAVTEYLETGTVQGGTDLYEQMSKEQKDWFQITKKAFARMSPEKELRIRK